jgi:hypothetical protein
MTFQLLHRRSSFCRCTMEAWVIVGVMCESQTFYGDDRGTVQAQAMRWVKQQFARTA